MPYPSVVWYSSAPNDPEHSMTLLFISRDGRPAVVRPTQHDYKAITEAKAKGLKVEYK